jgi:hypothetical protein
MNNEPVAWMRESDKEVCSIKGKQELLDEEGTDWNFKIPLYTHPAKPIKDREADRKRFSDEGFNRWLDESISDSGHTVYDLVENVCDAWHGWENSQYYRPAKTLTDEEIIAVGNAVVNHIDSNEGWIEFARAILKKASEK